MRNFKDTRGKSWFDIVPDMDGQVDITVTYPGGIRAFHHHNIKTELFFVVEGDYKLVLSSEVTGNEIVYLSQGDDYRIKPGVWHGYQVLGNKPGIIMEWSSHKHDQDNPDDDRKPYNEFDDWKKEKK
jgi:dTDP-4-dehydrorhamnose 3,5-epimerase